MITLKTWQNNKQHFKDAGVVLPNYDVKAVKKSGRAHPRWIHIGAGNLYRTFHAEIADDLANKGLLDCGIVAANMRSQFAIDNVYTPFNDDILMVTMCRDGGLKKRVLASTADALFASPERNNEWNLMLRYFEDDTLQMVTYTITEKGYVVKDSDNKFSAEAQKDVDEGPEAPITAMGRTCALLLARFNAGAKPIAMVTTDNFSQNGKHFRDAVVAIANAWEKQGYVTQEFVDYVTDETCVSFPWSMIDRITPNPSPEVAKLLHKQGFSDVDIVHTPGGTGFSSFANTEETRYLVIEDSFPNGRPALAEAGVIMCDRKTAELADTMKVTGCLNPLHTCMAIYGCLLGYTRIWQEMEDKDIVELIKHMGYDEDLPVLEDPKVIVPADFIQELLEKRLPNKSLPDAPQRIACDTSQKIPIRYGCTITSYVNSKDKDVAELVYIPLTIAGWLRYLIGVDDKGNKFEISYDPMLDELKVYLKDIKLGQTDPKKIHKAVEPILSNETIFKNDLYKINLGDKIEHMFADMLASPGAVRKTIQKYV